jgi:heat shock protein HslJ
MAHAFAPSQCRFCPGFCAEQSLTSRRLRIQNRKHDPAASAARIEAATWRDQMNTRAGAALAGLAAVLVLAACSGITGVRSQQGHAALADTQWVLQTLNGEAVLAGTSITAQFSESEIAGSSGCNSYSGSYTVTGSTIRIEGVATTAMACIDPEGVMDQEALYVDTLLSVNNFELDAGQLTLRAEDGRRLVFTAAP